MIYTAVAVWLLYGIVLGIFFLILRNVWREWKAAIEKDENEDTNKHVKKLLVQYAIIVVVCTAGFFTVRHFREGTVLETWGHKLYGGPVPTSAPATPTINPFYR